MVFFYVLFGNDCKKKDMLKNKNVSKKNDIVKKANGVK